MFESRIELGTMGNACRYRSIAALWSPAWLRAIAFFTRSLATCLSFSVGGLGSARAGLAASSVASTATAVRERPTMPASYHVGSGRLCEMREQRGHLGDHLVVHAAVRRQKSAAMGQLRRVLDRRAEQVA